jgi:acyl-ACP thioesterase
VTAGNGSLGALDGRPGVFRSTYRVRFDEADAAGNLRLSGFLRYAQDIAWQHSERLGFDRDWYAERGLAWVVRAVAVDVLAEVPMGRDVELATAVVGHRRIWARRLVRVAGPDGGHAATIETDWVLLDGRGRPVRIPGVFGEVFDVPRTTDPMLRVPATRAPTQVRRTELVVRETELDPLGHVNNAVYVDWLEDAVWAATRTATTPAAAPTSSEPTASAPPRAPAPFGPASAAAAARRPDRLRIEYVTPAVAGELVTTETWRAGEAWQHVQRAGAVELTRSELHLGPAVEAP